MRVGGRFSGCYLLQGRKTQRFTGEREECELCVCICLCAGTAVPDAIKGVLVASGVAAPLADNQLPAVWFKPKVRLLRDTWRGEQQRVMETELHACKCACVCVYIYRPSGSVSWHASSKTSKTLYIVSLLACGYLLNAKCWSSAK